jgi:hypothetical protein
MLLRWALPPERNVYSGAGHSYTLLDKWVWPRGRPPQHTHKFKEIWTMGETGSSPKPYHFSAVDYFTECLWSTIKGVLLTET